MYEMKHKQRNSQIDGKCYVKKQRALAVEYSYTAAGKWQVAGNWQLADSYLAVWQ